MKYLQFLVLVVATACMVTGCGTRKARGRTVDVLRDYPRGWTYYLADPDADMGDVWRVEEDVLICRGTPLGYLYTTRDYDNFILRLQWRWAPGQDPGKGGVLIRMTGDHKVWPKSLEAQINANDAGDFWGLDGYVYSGDPVRRSTLLHDSYGTLTHLKKTRAMEKSPGQWNTYEIRAQGGTVTLLINGRQVNEAVDCPETPGRICLTSEGNEIHFREISLIPLD